MYEGGSDGKKVGFDVVHSIGAQFDRLDRRVGRGRVGDGDAAVRAVLTFFEQVHNERGRRNEHASGDPAIPFARFLTDPRNLAEELRYVGRREKPHPICLPTKLVEDVMNATEGRRRKMVAPAVKRSEAQPATIKMDEKKKKKIKRIRIRRKKKIKRIRRNHKKDHLKRASGFNSPSKISVVSWVNAASTTRSVTLFNSAILIFSRVPGR